VAPQLEIRNLHVRTEDREILRGVDLSVRRGELHALMGPNGSGKSTLANTIMGHPDYEVTEGEILFDGANIVEMAPHERSKLGLFLAFQYPVAIPGVSVANFLRMAINARR
jgi:Fe-S cluster assembly ATP-binding protein